MAAASVEHGLGFSITEPESFQHHQRVAALDHCKHPDEPQAGRGAHQPVEYASDHAHPRPVWFSGSLSRILTTCSRIREGSAYMVGSRYQSSRCFGTIAKVGGEFLDDAHPRISYFAGGDFLKRPIRNA